MLQKSWVSAAVTALAVAVWLLTPAMGQAGPKGGGEEGEDVAAVPRAAALAPAALTAAIIAAGIPTTITAATPITEGAILTIPA
jgi:hypothetical protein